MAAFQPDRTLDGDQVSELVVARRDGTQVTVIYQTGQLIEAPNWTHDGKWLICNADGRLYRIAADGQGDPDLIDTAPIETLNNDHVLAPDGQTIYLSANDGHLYRCPLTGGVPVRLSNDQDPLRRFRYYLHGVSPDGHTLTYVGMEKVGDQTVTRICTIPAGGGADKALTDGSCPVDGPEYSADGAWIYFNSEAAATQPGHAQIFRMRPDGTEVEQLTRDARVHWFPHPSPDGTCWSFISFPAGTQGHPADKDVIICTMDPEGGAIREIDRFNGGQGSINVNSWAPDSEKFAYVRYPRRG